MLSLASYPPNRQEIEQWFADHQRQWEVGEAHRFAVVLVGKMVGLTDIVGIEGTLGYWIGLNLVEIVERFSRPREEYISQYRCVKVSDPLDRLSKRAAQT